MALRCARNIALSNADAAAIVGGDARRPPVAGKVTLRAELEASGRSPAAFIGSLAGTGTISLEHAQLAGLNPRVFDAVIRAVDLGIPTEPDRIRDFVATALENGTLPAAHAEAAITIAAGQARLSHVIARTSGADLSAAANVDLVDGALDAVLTLAGTPSQAGGPRPTLSIALKGPWHAPSRTIDANALASWLALRAVEQQAKQVDLMEQQQRERAAARGERPAAEAVPAPSPAAVAPAPGGDATSALPRRRRAAAAACDQCAAGAEAARRAACRGCAGCLAQRRQRLRRPQSDAARRSAVGFTRRAELTAASASPIMSRARLALDRRGLAAVVIEHEQPDRRRQIAVMAFGVDAGDQIGQGHIAIVGDVLQALPERILKTDAGLVVGDHDRSFDNR